jgi:hypothetical protein
MREDIGLFECDADANQVISRRSQCTGVKCNSASGPSWAVSVNFLSALVLGRWLLIDRTYQYQQMSLFIHVLTQSVAIFVMSSVYQLALHIHGKVPAVAAGLSNFALPR